MHQGNEDTRPANPDDTDSDTRRSGEDRRRETAPVSADRRQNPERRELLQNLDEIIAHYRVIPLFDGLTREQMVRVLRICAKKKIPGEHKLHRSGQETHEVSILLRGTIRILSQSGDVWMKLTPYGTIGETGVFIDDPFTGDVITDTECIILNINREELAHLTDADPDLHVKLLRNVLRGMAEKLWRDHDEMVRLKYRLQALDRI